MESIIYTQEKSVAHIIVNRPQSLNAFNESMLRELKAVLEDIQADASIKVVLVKGAGRAFSAGVDLKTTSASDFYKESSFMKLGQEVGELFTNLQQVTIAQVHGYCFTGALEMMLFFDMAFCTEDTQFGDTHAKWSVMPRWGMTQRLSRRVGLAKAKELSFRAMRVKGVEAERIGLVNRAFPADELDSEVSRIVAEILENSFEAIVEIKKLYNAGFHMTLGEGLQLEADTDVKLSNTGDQLSSFKST